MAIDMWSELALEISDSFMISVDGIGSETVPLDQTNLVCVGQAAVVGGTHNLKVV
jgi:hypothetical protein